MKTNHLTTWEQEEYVLNQRTPEMLHHLTECAGCRAAVARLEHGVAIFRSAAVEWSAEQLAARPQRFNLASAKRFPVFALGWTVAAALPVLLLFFALVSYHPSITRPAHPASQMSDDALLEQVDQQISADVPSSMESLNQLVTSDERNGQAGATSIQGNKHIVQTN
jgi:anti-sigma factor RsiW